jgi:hypothetical protein
MKSLEEIFSKLNAGEISDSRAFKEYQNAGGDGTFKDFMQNAVDNGWLQKVGSTVGGFLTNKYGSESQIEDLPCPDGYTKDDTGVCVEIPKQGLSTGAIIGISVGAIAVIGTIIYVVNKDK